MLQKQRGCNTPKIHAAAGGRSEGASPELGISNRADRTLQIISGLCSGPIPRIVGSSRPDARTENYARGSVANPREGVRKREGERRGERAVEYYRLNHDMLDNLTATETFPSRRFQHHHGRTVSCRRRGARSGTSAAPVASRNQRRFCAEGARTRNTRFCGAVNFKLQKYARARRRK